MKPLRSFEFVAFFVGSMVVAWHPLIRTLRLAAENDGYTHILLILPVSLTFIFVDRKLLQPLVRSNRRYGSLILCTAGVIVGLSVLLMNRITSDLQLSLDILALVIWWIGSFVFCFGTRASQSALFPLCFLLWIVPLPSFALDEVTGFLQQGSALAAHVLFVTAGVPVAQDGLMLSIPGLTVEVAKECSSIRSSLMLLVTTMVLARLFLTSSFHKALLILLAFPLAIAKNGLRIWMIAMLATRVDPGFLTGRLHHQGGIVFFTISLFIIFALLRILRNREDRRKQKPGLVAEAP